MGSTEINVPTDLQVVLREFTKSVLRDMPTDVLAYSKDYFVERAHEKRMESYQLPGSTSKPFNELSAVLQQQIEDVFKRYDSDCDMSISLEELRTLMGDLGGLFGFSEEVDASTLMALLDADGNQEISWQVSEQQRAPVRRGASAAARQRFPASRLAPRYGRSRAGMVACVCCVAGRHERRQLRRASRAAPHASGRWSAR